MASRRKRLRIEAWLAERGFTICDKLTPGHEPDTLFKIKCRKGHKSFINFRYWQSHATRGLECKTCAIRRLVLVGSSLLLLDLISLPILWDYLGYAFREIIVAMFIFVTLLILLILIIRVNDGRQHLLEEECHRLQVERTSRIAAEFPSHGNNDDDQMVMGEGIAATPVARDADPGFVAAATVSPIPIPMPAIHATKQAFARVKQDIAAPFVIYIDEADMPLLPRDPVQRSWVEAAMGGPANDLSTSLTALFNTFETTQVVLLSRYPVLDERNNLRWRLRFAPPIARERECTAFTATRFDITSGSKRTTMQLVFDLIPNERGLRIQNISTAPVVPRRLIELRVGVDIVLSLIKDMVANAQHVMDAGILEQCKLAVPRWDDKHVTWLKAVLQYLDDFVDELGKRIRAGFAFTSFDPGLVEFTFHAPPLPEVKVMLDKLPEGTEVFLAIPRDASARHSDPLWCPDRDEVMLYTYEPLGIVTTSKDGEPWALVVRLHKSIRPEEQEKMECLVAQATYVVNSAWQAIAPYVGHRNALVAFTRGVGLNPRLQGLYFDLDVGSYLPPSTVALPDDPGINAVVGDEELDPGQLSAIQLGLSRSDASIINGPPGTGKTQILSVITVMRALRGERVNVVTQSNKARDVILERVAREKTGRVPILCIGNDQKMMAIARRYTKENAPRTYLEEVVAPRLKGPIRDEMPEYIKAMGGQEGKWAAFCDEMARLDYVASSDELAWFSRSYLSSVPVWFMTSYQAAMMAVSPDPEIFCGVTACDALVLDECSKLEPYEVIGAWSSADQLIAGGDARQIPPHPADLPDDVETQVKLEFQERYQMLFSELWFEQIQAQIRKQFSAWRVPLLVQFRMSRPAMAVQNVFNPEGEKLRSGLPSDEISRPLPPGWQFPFTKAFRKKHDGWAWKATPYFIFINSTAKEIKARSRTNPGHVTLARALVLSWLPHLSEIEGGPKNILLISYYADMVASLHLMVQELRATYPDWADRIKDRVSVGTVDSNQGDEADIVIVCMAASRPSSFTRQPGRVNVSLSRVKYQLVVIGSDDNFNDEGLSLSTLRGDKSEKVKVFNLIFQMAREWGTYIDETAVNTNWRLNERT